MSGTETYSRSMFSLTNHEIFVLTAHHDGRDNGQVATWIMPATLVPERPRIAAILSPRNYTHELIAGDGRFILHMLAADQHELLPRFGLHSGRDRDKFDGLTIRRSATGLPIIEGCCGWAECRILTSLDAGDRIVYIADIVEQELRPGCIPLRKQEAFAAQPEDVRILLEEKHRVDGERDRAFMKTFDE
ncbi:MAG: flavin reductase [Bacteroidetes bacterium]|nr:flavin reductase [Bacteroidota bacterium]